MRVRVNTLPCLTLPPGTPGCRLQGNLSEFVKVKPEAKTYYQLSAATTKFKFPEPGFLDGIRGERLLCSGLATWAT